MMIGGKKYILFFTLADLSSTGEIKHIVIIKDHHPKKIDYLGHNEVNDSSQPLSPKSM